MQKAGSPPSGGPSVVNEYMMLKIPHEPRRHLFTSKERSALMSRIGARNTRPELRVRRFLHGRGLRFRLHASDLPGKPDIVLPKYKTVVLVHGCFWHKCP